MSLLASVQQFTCHKHCMPDKVRDREDIAVKQEVTWWYVWTSECNHSTTPHVCPVLAQVSLPAKHVNLHELVLSEVEQALHDAIFRQSR